MNELFCSPRSNSILVRSITGVAMLVVLLIAPINAAHACACCSQAGQRYDATNEFGSFEQEILQAIKFKSTAELFGSADDAFGLIDPTIEEDENLLEFAMVSTITPGLLTFRLSHAGKTRGTIRFPMPQRKAEFLVDIRDGKSSEGHHGPSLYKEWRFNGNATLSGLAKQGTHKAKIELILQGRGISCPTVEDFSHWSMAIDGENVQFRLTGALSRQKP